MAVKTRLLDFVDVSTIIISGAIFAFLKFLGEPPFTGFFCSDISLRFPFSSSTVPSILNNVISYGVPLITLLLLHKHVVSRLEFDWRKFLFDVKQLIFYGLMTQVTTHVIKYTTGRLRPHFIEVCRPSNVSSALCGDLHDQNFILEYSCLGNSELFPDQSERDKRILEARLSFPSGHTSIAFYGMLTAWLVISRFRVNLLPVQLAQVACMVYAVYVAVSRVTDHKHHVGDVIGGAVLGALLAVVASLRMKSQNGERDRSRRILLDDVTSRSHDDVTNRSHDDVSPGNSIDDTLTTKGTVDITQLYQRQETVLSKL